MGILVEYMKIYKALIIIAISSVILGITTQISYATQRVTIVPTQTYAYNLSGMTGETFEFSLDTNNYVYASNASGSPLTTGSWSKPGTGQWTWLQSPNSGQWVPDIVTTAPGVYVVSVSGYYMRKGPGKGEAKWIQFISTVNNTVSIPHIQLTASPSSVIADGSSTATLTAKILDKDNKVMTSKTDLITFALLNPGLGNITSTNPVNAVAGIAEATFQAGTQVAQDPPLTIKATSPNITEGSVQIIIDPKLDHVIIIMPPQVVQAVETTYTLEVYDMFNKLWSYGNLSYKWPTDGGAYLKDEQLSELKYIFTTLGAHSVGTLVTYKTQSVSDTKNFNVLKAIEITAPNPQTFSFISTDNITCTGNVNADFSLNSQINWIIEDNPDDTIDSGNPTDPSPGANVSFTPNPPSAPNGRGKPLSYRITDKIIYKEQEYNDQIIITQDERDQIRQEYKDMGKARIPARAEFVDSNTYVNPGHFPFSEIQSPDYNWAIFMIAQHLENIRVAINNKPMSVNSGYRNPRYNGQIGGAQESPHMYGIAVDIKLEDFDGDGDQDGNDWKILKDAAKNEGACVEPFDMTPTWVHMDWRGTCPIGW